MSPPPSSASRAAITSAAASVVGWPPAKSSIVPSSPTVDEVAAEGHLVGPQPQPEGGGLDRRPAGVEAGGVVAEDRHVADVAARRQARRDHRGAADLAPAASAGSVGIDATSSGVRPPSSADRLVGAPVGHAHHVLHAEPVCAQPSELGVATNR